MVIYYCAVSLHRSVSVVSTPVPVWLVPPIVACAWLIGYAFALAIEVRARKAFEATLSETELAEFNAYRAVLPWRNFANVVATDRLQVAAALGEIASLSDLSDSLRALRWKLMAARGVQIHRTPEPLAVKPRRIDSASPP
jgi:transketolase N-terminal domain/subunit